MIVSRSRVSNDELQREKELRDRVQNSRSFSTFQRLQQQAQDASKNIGGSQGTNSPFGGSPINATGWDFNSRQQQRSRFWAGIVIFVAGLVLLKRAGWTGDFSDFKVPYWSIGIRQQAMWMIYNANVSASRRHEIKRLFDEQRYANPNSDFFAFVDAVEPFWCWSNSFNKEQVIQIVANTISTGGAMQLFGALRNTMSDGWLFSAPKDNGARIDGLVRALDSSRMFGSVPIGFVPPMPPQFVQPQFVQPVDLRPLHSQPSFQHHVQPVQASFKPDDLVKEVDADRRAHAELLVLDSTTVRSNHASELKGL